jgi:hypothetical protein
MAAPSVYAAINAVTAELAKIGIAKSRINEADGYQYRSIDDVLDRLAPLLAEKRLCILPRVVERFASACSDEASHLLSHVAIRMKFKLVSVEDGSSHSVEAYGEALDPSDKATAKAMSAAYKSAMVQTFCIPIAGAEDPDRSSPRPSSRTHVAEPVQGWEQWARDIEDIVSLCESEQAIGLVQERNRELLKSLSREQPALYRELGEAITARREALYQRAAAEAGTKRRSRAKMPRPKAAAQARETEDA